MIEDKIINYINEILSEIIPQESIPIWWEKPNNSLGGATPKAFVKTPGGAGVILDLVNKMSSKG